MEMCVGSSPLLLSGGNENFNEMNGAGKAGIGGRSGKWWPGGAGAVSIWPQCKHM